MNNITKYMRFSLITNLFLCVLKIVFGFVTKTKTLVADGIHSCSDLIMDFVSILGGKLSLKKENNNYPMGFGRIEYITSLFISIFIIYLGISLFENSFTNKNNVPSIYVCIVLLITIILKYFLSNLLISKGKKYNSMILISSGKESKTDLYSSILLLFIILISQLYIYVPILEYSDMIGSLFISIMIVVIGLRIFIENVLLLIGRCEDSADKTKIIQDIVLNRKEKIYLNKCIIMKIGSYYNVILDIFYKDKKLYKKTLDIIKNIKFDLYNSSLNIKYVNICIYFK